MEASTAKGTSSVSRPLANVRWEYALFAAVAVAGIAMRVAVSRSTIGALEGDEATWGLMARHVLDGELTAFFWGQAYGGTQEVALVAALFSVFGTHLTLMRLVPIALTVASAFVVWRIGRRTIGELPALVAAFLLWVWPAYLAWKLQIWHGFYGTGLLYASLVLLLVLRMAERPTKREAAVLGLVLGLAVWQTVQIVAVAAPALLWLTLRRPSAWRLVWVALPAFVLGALPWFLSNLQHDWWSFRLLGDETPYLTRLRGFANGTFPMLLGLRVPFSNDWLLGQPVSGAIYVGAACLFAYLAWRWRRTPMTLFVLVVVTYPFLYAANGLTWLTNEPRYVVLLSPALVLLIAKPATTLPRAAAVLGIATVLSTLFLAQWVSWRHDYAAEARVDPRYLRIEPAIEALDRAGVDRAFAGYWLAYRIMFETRERVIVSEWDLHRLMDVEPDRVVPPTPRDHTEHHHPAYDRAVREAPRHAYLVVRGELDEEKTRRVLRRHGYRETSLGNLYLLVSPPQQG